MDLIAFTRNKGVWGFEFVRKLSPREAAAYDHALQHLLEFRASRELLPMVQGNESDLSRFVSLLKTIPDPQGLRPREVAELTGSANRYIVNYLTSMKVFLDHTQTRLSRRYSTSSHQVNAFVEATRQAFDSTPAYRILSKLRNYVQHCGMPVWVGRVSQLGDGSTTAFVHETTIRCNPALLLKHHKDWGLARADLIAAGEQLEIAELLPPVTQELRKIQDAVTASELPTLTAEATKIATVLGEVKAPHSATVGTIERRPPYTDITVSTPPFEVLAALGFNVRTPPL